MTNRILKTLLALLFFVSLSGTVKAASLVVNVNGKSGPWLPSINSPGYVYGVNDQVAPSVIDSSSGISFGVGNTITIEYIDGLTSAWSTGSNFANANGHTTYVSNANSGSSGEVFPSYYIDSSEYPAYLMVLIGTFADSSGVIVGTPFKVGNGPFNAIVPVGASQLQLGFNDDVFGDNRGSINVLVSGTSVTPAPEPSAMLLGFAGLAGICRRRKKSA